MANRLCHEDVYAWSIVSLDGAPVAASNGLALAPTAALDAMGPVDVVFVCGGVDVQRAVSRELLSALRRLAHERVALGSLCTGGYALAKAGLLDKYRAAIHWENMSALREEFPRIDFTEQLFAIDRDRYTCSGGIAPLDLMLNLIKDDLGRDIAPADLGAVHPRSHPQRPRPPAHSAAGAGRRLPRAADQGGGADGGQHRGAAGARCARGVDRRVAPPDRAPLQAASRPGADEVLPGAAAAPRARAAAADVDVDHGHHHGLRLPVAAALLQVLPQRVRVSAERRAGHDPRGEHEGRGRIGQ